MFKFAVEGLAGAAFPFAGTEPPHAVKERSPAKPMIEAAKGNKNVNFSRAFCAEQGMQNNIYEVLLKGFGGHSSRRVPELARLSS
jgi:hypothetical protein